MSAQPGPALDASGLTSGAVIRWTVFLADLNHCCGDRAVRDLWYTAAPTRCAVQLA